MIVAGVDEFDGNHAATEQPADLLMAGGVAAHAIAGVERVAAEERVAGAFEAEVFGDFDDLETIFGKPAAIVGLFALPLAVTEARDERLRRKIIAALAVNTKSGRPVDGFQQRCLGAGIDDVREQRMPLRDRHGVFGLARHVHPRIDLVVDAVEIRRAHQDVGLMLSHALMQGR